MASPREGASVAQAEPQVRVVHDDQIVVAAWDEADAEGPELPDVEYVADGRSVIVRRSTSIPEPERVAQLPNDPFDSDDAAESNDETLPAPNTQMEEAQDAVKNEMDRRKSSDDENYDIFDDPAVAEPSRENLEGRSPLEEDEETDLTPTVEDDETNLEPADTRLFDEMTTEDEESPTDESMQYGAGDTPLDMDQPSSEELTEEQRRMLEQERAESEESCQEELDKLRAQTLESIDLSIRVQGNAGEDYPFECALGNEQLAPRQWPQITYMWKASGLCHKPLYFEQVALERYGHTWGPYTQPIMSGIHFFGTLPILPYKMGLQTPNECVYSLGYYRPGNCAPWLVGGIPFTWRAAAFETGVATGLNFVIP